MSAAEPWYGDGLQFACTRCGNCCTGAPGYVWVSEAEVGQIAELRGETPEKIGQQFIRLVGSSLSLIEHPNGDCVFYDRENRGCKIYPVRPRQCHTWPFWVSNLRSKEAWEETCKVCPGAGRGEFVSAEEVQRRAAVIRL